MKICSKCRKQNPDDARFCLRCGTPLEDPEAVREAEDRKDRKDIEETADASESLTGNQPVSSGSPFEKPADFAGDTKEEFLNAETASLPDQPEKADMQADETPADAVLQTPAEESREETAAPVLPGDESPAENQETAQPENPEATDVTAEEKKEAMHIGFVQPTIITKPEPKPVTVQPAEADEAVKPEADDEEEEEQDEQKKWLIVAVFVLSLAVVCLGGLLLYQHFNRPDQSSSVPAESMVEFSEDFEEESVSALSPKAESSEEEHSEMSFFEYSFEDDDSRRAPVHANERSMEDDSQELNDDNETETADYRANFVMKVRSGPSLEDGQTGRIDEGETVHISQNRESSDGSLWGKLEGSDGWVCLHDSEQTYFTKDE